MTVFGNIAGCDELAPLKVWMKFAGMISRKLGKRSKVSIIINGNINTSWKNYPNIDFVFFPLCRKN